MLELAAAPALLVEWEHVFVSRLHQLDLMAASAVFGSTAKLRWNQAILELAKWICMGRASVSKKK